MKRTSKPPPAPTWTGELRRTAGGIVGGMSDQYGWRMLMTGRMDQHAEPACMWLRGDVATAGEPVNALREALRDIGNLTGSLEAGTDDAWTGDLVYRQHVVTLTAKVISPARIELRGRG